MGRNFCSIYENPGSCQAQKKKKDGDNFFSFGKGIRWKTFINSVHGFDSSKHLLGIITRFQSVIFQSYFDGSKFYAISSSLSVTREIKIKYKVCYRLKSIVVLNLSMHCETDLIQANKLN